MIIFTQIMIIFTQIMIIFTQIMIIFTQIMIIFTQIMIIFTQIMIIFTQIMIIFTQIMIIFTQIMIKFTQIMIIFTCGRNVHRVDAGHVPYSPSRWRNYHSPHLTHLMLPWETWWHGGKWLVYNSNTEIQHWQYISINCIQPTNACILVTLTK